MVKLNKQYNMIIPSVVTSKEVSDIQNIEVEYPADWRSFMSAREILQVTIVNSQNNPFDRLIDFENEDLCEKIEVVFSAVCTPIACAFIRARPIHASDCADMPI